MDIGKSLKQLRLAHTMTQKELADRCNLTKGHISQIENNLTSPPINTLIVLLECLGSDLSTFFSKQPEKDPVVYKGEDASHTLSEDGQHEIHWLIPPSATLTMEPIKLKLLAGSTEMSHVGHDGEEYGYVLKGRAKLKLGKKSYKLKKGDSFYYRANEYHALTNPYSIEAIILWISTPPNF